MTPAIRDAIEAALRLQANADVFLLVQDVPAAQQALKDARQHLRDVLASTTAEEPPHAA